MQAMNIQQQQQRQKQWETVVLSAAHTVWRDDEVTAAYVVLPERPGYRQLARFRDCEQELDLNLTVISNGGIAFRKHSEPELSPTLDRPDANFLPALAPGSHARLWLHEFMLSTEGVR
jgi:hypothetical protein